MRVPPRRGVTRAFSVVRFQQTCCVVQGKHHGCRQGGKAGGKAKRKHYKKTVLNLRKRVPDIDQIQVGLRAWCRRTASRHPRPALTHCDED